MPDGQRVTWDEAHKLITEGLIHDPSTLIFEWAASQLEIKQPSSLTATQTKIRDKLERALKELDLERDVPIRIVLLDGKTKTQRFPTLGDSVWALSNTADDAHYLEAGAIGHAYPSVYMTRELLRDISHKTLADRLKEEIGHALEKANGVRKEEHWEDDPSRSNHLSEMRGDIQQAERYREGILVELGRESQAPIVLSNSVEQHLRNLPHEDLQAIFARRLNLRFEAYRQLFLSLWSTNPIAAFEYLGAGVLTDQDVVGSIRELRVVQVPDWMKACVPAAILKGRFMVQYRYAKSPTIRIEWAYFPDLNQWLPVSAVTVQNDKPVSERRRIRSVFVMRDGFPVFLKFFLTGLTQKTWPKLAAAGNEFRIYGQTPASGAVSLVSSSQVSNESNMEARTAGVYEFARNLLELYGATIDSEGFAHRLDWEGTGEGVLFMHAVSRSANEPDKILAAVIMRNQSLLESLSTKFETYWIKARLPQDHSSTGPFSMKLGTFKNLGTHTALPFEIHLNRKWAGRPIEIQLRRGIPVYIRILDQDTGFPLKQHFLKLLEVRSRDGEVLKTIRPYYSSTYSSDSEPVKTALAIAQARGGYVVVTNLNLRKSPYYIIARAFEQTTRIPRRNVPDDQQANAAEIVFSPSIISGQPALKLNKLRVGRYNHDDPLSADPRYLVNVTECKLDIPSRKIPNDAIKLFVGFPMNVRRAFSSKVNQRNWSIFINELLFEWLQTPQGSTFLPIQKMTEIPNHVGFRFRIPRELYAAVEDRLLDSPLGVTDIIRTLVKNYVNRRQQPDPSCLTAA